MVVVVGVGIVVVVGQVLLIVGIDHNYIYAVLESCALAYQTDNHQYFVYGVAEADEHDDEEDGESVVAKTELEGVAVEATAVAAIQTAARVGSSQVGADRAVVGVEAVELIDVESQKYCPYHDEEYSI